MLNRLSAFWREHRGAVTGLSVVLGLCLLRFALGLPCPIAYLTGISCPGCGMTRGLWSLVTLDFPAAWHHHPASFALPPACILWGVFCLKGRKKAAHATLIAFALLLVLIYLWRILNGGGGVLVLDPRSGLIGRVVAEVFHIIQTYHTKEIFMTIPVFLELLKSLLYGIVEGITEWLPVSSTGHLILLGELCPLQVSEAFSEMFDVVIQLGAILAVIVLFFRKLNPFAPSKSALEKKNTWGLWFRVCVAVIPSAVIGVLLDDWLDAHLYNYITVAVALVVYGILFIIIEKCKPADSASVADVGGIGYKLAFLIGLFKILSLIPGTSRSGSTILGAMLLGCSRGAAAEFSFFMAIPTMLGASLLKAVKLVAEGVTVTTLEWGILAIGCVTAFFVSLAAIRFLTDFVKKHSFASFGWYRIALGVLVVGYFLLFGRA